ncbi:MAG: J domain-containing protein [Sphingobacteriia bacterium]|nr:MAG: J domain-containing protein [Sphingobacteriia bacterium]TAG32205.1 MAG: J domain-containing protein [Sphingobacteriia bacterium]
MLLENWYKVLGISVNATNTDIKKAFRRLAKKYHPDKSSAQGSHAKFIQIKAAYEVLSDPIKRQEYNQHFFFSSFSHTADAIIHTEAELFESFARLEKKFNQSDIRFFDFDAASQLIKQLLTNYTFNEIIVSTALNNRMQLLKLILNCVKYTKLYHALQLTEMVSLYFTDEQEIKQIQYFISQQKWQYYQEKYTLYIVLFLSILICCTIMWVGTK